MSPVIFSLHVHKCIICERVLHVSKCGQTVLNLMQLNRLSLIVMTFKMRKLIGYDGLLNDPVHQNESKSNITSGVCGWVGVQGGGWGGRLFTEFPLDSQ